MRTKTRKKRPKRKPSKRIHFHLIIPKGTQITLPLHEKDRDELGDVDSWVRPPVNKMVTSVTEKGTCQN